MDRETRVERDQPASISHRHFDQPRVVHLLMPDGAPVELRIVCGWGTPEVMRFEPGPLAQERGSVPGADRIRRVSRVRGESDKSKLREGAGGPALAPVFGKPCMGMRMVLVVWPGQREEHVGVEQGRFHVASSASNSFARLLGITGASGDTRKTGKPSLLAVSADARKPRRASCESTSPRLFPAACACARAASNTSSSNVTVVLMRGYVDVVMRPHQAISRRRTRTRAACGLRVEKRISFSFESRGVVRGHRGENFAQLRR